MKLNAMKNMMVSIPSIGLQNKIADTLSSGQHEIGLLKPLVDICKTQKHDLMQKLLTRVWRLRKEVINRYEEA